MAEKNELYITRWVLTDYGVSEAGDSVGTTDPEPDTVWRYWPGEVVDIEAIANTGYFFRYWEGEGIDDLYDPTTTISMDYDRDVKVYFQSDIELNQPDSLQVSTWEDRASLLLENILDTYGLFEDLADDKYAFFSLAQLLRGEEVPDDPFYDDDGDPSTPEMLMTDGLVKFLDEIGTQLFVGEGYGTAEEWAAKTLVQKCQWIQDYVAP